VFGLGIYSQEDEKKIWVTKIAGRALPSPRQKVQAKSKLAANSLLRVSLKIKDIFI